MTWKLFSIPNAFTLHSHAEPAEASVGHWGLGRQAFGDGFMGGLTSREPPF